MPGVRGRRPGQNAGPSGRIARDGGHGSASALNHGGRAAAFGSVSFLLDGERERCQWWGICCGLLWLLPGDWPRSFFAAPTSWMPLPENRGHLTARFGLPPSGWFAGAMLALPPGVCAGHPRPLSVVCQSRSRTPLFPPGASGLALLSSSRISARERLLASRCPSPPPHSCIVQTQLPRIARVQTARMEPTILGAHCGPRKRPLAAPRRSGHCSCCASGSRFRSPRPSSDSFWAARRGNGLRTPHQLQRPVRDAPIRGRRWKGPDSIPPCVQARSSHR
jgi:hypothetical protein